MTMMGIRTVYWKQW